MVQTVKEATSQKNAQLQRSSLAGEGMYLIGRTPVLHGENPSFIPQYLKVGLGKTPVWNSRESTTSQEAILK